MAAVLTARTPSSASRAGGDGRASASSHQIVRAYRRMAPYVRHDYGNDLFGEPAGEHKQTVQKYGADEQDGAVLQDDDLQPPPTQHQCASTCVECGQQPLLV
ncbi:hypothetical protein ACIPUC_01005 [Streptomyces sp. LARHCF249]